MVDHEGVAAVIKGKVALFVDETVGFARLGAVLMGEIVEVEALGPQEIAVDAGLAVGVGGAEDAVVFAQRTVDAVHQFSGSGFAAVVIGAAALVRAKTLVDAPAQDFAAQVGIERPVTAYMLRQLRHPPFGGGYRHPLYPGSP